MVRQDDGRMPWTKIYDYMMACGCEHDPKSFVATALDEIEELAPYDQGLAYCIDEHRNVCFQHFHNLKSRWSNMFIEYYSKLPTTSRNLTAQVEESRDAPYVDTIDWLNEPMSEFISDCIMVRGVKTTLAFALFDLNGLPRACFSLDRTRDARFSESETEAVRYAAAHIGNLFKNFFVNPAEVPGMRRQHTDADLASLLTKREREVVELLCQGLAPAHVAKALHINVSTAYKHISHIYRKLGVSSQQELLVRILGTTGMSGPR